MYFAIKSIDTLRKVAKNYQCKKNYTKNQNCHTWSHKFSKIITQLKQISFYIKWINYFVYEGITPILWEDIFVYKEPFILSFLLTYISYKLDINKVYTISSIQKCFFTVLVLYLPTGTSSLSQAFIKYNPSEIIAHLSGLSSSVMSMLSVSSRTLGSALHMPMLATTLSKSRLTTSWLPQLCRLKTACKLLLI